MGVARGQRHQDEGFTLIEALVATTVLAVGVVSVAHLAVVSARVNAAARQNGVVALLARDKMEQLRALSWTSDAGAVPVSDWSTDITTMPPRPAGGPGLGFSPPDALLQNIDGFCDFADANGVWVGADAAPDAAWVRRWSIGPVIGLTDTLRFDVVVVPAHAGSPGAAVSRARPIAGAHLVGMRARRAR